MYFEPEFFSSSPGHAQPPFNTMADCVAKKASQDIVRRARTISSHQNKLWNVASRAPMYCKMYEKTTTEGKKKVKKIVKRSSRLIGGHAYGIAAAGATQAIAREQQIDCANMGIEFDRLNEKGVPVCQAALTPAFKYMLEQFICAYVQECIHTAQSSMQAVGRHTRLNRGIMKMACQEVNEQVFAASGMAPRNVYVVPLARKKKVADVDDEFKPATQEEVAAEEEDDNSAAAAAAQDAEE